ncbi:MAG: hypothetical protein FRX49_12981 [Trebouxia sp. A1-2]|nr:MAG: hypothetical protein FRX49_12981 [Trebouxia sp. A1-2]
MSKQLGVHIKDQLVFGIIIGQGRKVPGAPLTQNVLAAKQLAEHPDPIASDSEEDSESGLTELKAKKQSTSKSSAPAATQAPAGPLAHAESARPESGKTAPEASESSAQLGLLDRRQTRQDTEAKAANVNNVTSPTAAGPGFVSPVAIASDASPQPRFPFPLLKQVDNGAEKGIQESSCLASPVRLSLPEQLPPAVPMGPDQTSQADPSFFGSQAQNVQGSTCEAVRCQLMQLHRHLLSELMNSHESELGLPGYKAKVAANTTSQQTTRHEVLVLTEMLKVAEMLPAGSGVLKEQCQSLMQKRSELQVSLGQLTEAADELTGKQCEVISSLLPDKEDIIREVMADLCHTAATL